MRQRLASSAFNSIKRTPIEPVVGVALFIMTLGVSRGTAEAPSLSFALVMLAASFLLPWHPWAALALALCYSSNKTKYAGLCVVVSQSRVGYETRHECVFQVEV